MKNKCYKCGGEIGLIPLMQTDPEWMCIVCAYKIDKKYGKAIMPFTPNELELIWQGKKWTSLRSLEYDKFPFRKKKVYIHTLEDYKNMNIEYPTKFGVFMEDPFSIFSTIVTNSVVKSEGFKTFDELIMAFKKGGFKLPQRFFLYNLRKPKGDV